jgi:hypothetical protein
MDRITEPEPKLLKARREPHGPTRAGFGDAAWTTAALIAVLRGREHGLSEAWRPRLAPLPDACPVDLTTSDPNKG